ncbi:NAD(P)-binding protein [Aspergillus sclerotiicarbonarius CBS 121057]|uniref:NAD(P)-binding protein n=1 Tax=Aspergillus sclerotiicarbonarius (strain CBS 121057 / IBT 28362) TaxID=1448318 RepID=A0A319F5L8_ASPSB|nr:NAD(P)-binding protein [Aspergillus sclerotiicarbonarius CBS 121057]
MAFQPRYPILTPQRFTIISSKRYCPTQTLGTTALQARTHLAAFHTTPVRAMKGARVTSWGAPPEYMTVPDLPAPLPNQLQLKVLAVGVPRAVRGRAECKHPSAFGAPLPFDPSADGVGVDEATGDRYFINTLAAPLFAERANVDRSQLVKLNAAADPVTVAALANPTASSWMALRCRATGGCQGRTVVIVGATSASGRAGIAVARALGAARTVGVARDPDTLAKVEGLDDRVLLPAHPDEPLVLPPSIGPVHIVLDWVGGPAAVQLLQSAQTEPGENLQYIQVGGLAGHDTLVIPSRLINIKPICIMASGVGSLSGEDLKREMPGLVNTITTMRRPFEVFAAPMADVQSVWNSEEAQSKRLVLIP